MGGTLGTLLLKLTLPASHQEAGREGKHGVKAEEDDEAEEGRGGGKKKETGGPLYLAVELSPSVLLS